MNPLPAESDGDLSLESAGALMTPEEFDTIDDYDELYCYELVHGVLVVRDHPPPEEAGPNELLGHLLFAYQENHPRGGALDLTLPQQYVRTRTSRRLADRLIWAGLGRLASRRRDLAAIAVEFVSAGRRNQRRDYEEKRQEYLAHGVAEYWIIDRFRRVLTVVVNGPGGPTEVTVTEQEVYRTPRLPGFELPLARLLALADQWAPPE